MGAERVQLEVGELEVVATNDTIAIPPDTDGPVDGPSFGDALRHGLDVVARAIDGHAVRGHRPGAVPIAVTSARRGHPCEVVRPMLVDPLAASRLVLTEGFRRGHHRFITFGDHDAGAAHALAWDVVIEPPGRRPVRATLHLRASPSMVVTVLELIPREGLRWRSRGYLATGVAAVDSLAREFEHALAPRPCHGRVVAVS